MFGSLLARRVTGLASAFSPGYHQLAPGYHSYRDSAPLTFPPPRAPAQVTSEEFVSVIAFMAIPVGDGAMMDELLETFDKRGDGRVDYLEFLYMFHGAPTRKLWRQSNKPVLYSPPIGRKLPW